MRPISRGHCIEQWFRKLNERERAKIQVYAFLEIVEPLALASADTVPCAVSLRQIDFLSSQSRHWQVRIGMTRRFTFFIESLHASRLGLQECSKTGKQWHLFLVSKPPKNSIKIKSIANCTIGQHDQWHSSTSCQLIKRPASK